MLAAKKWQIYNVPMVALPDRDCPLCPRLAEFRRANARQYPQFYNGAVPSFGELDAELLIVGLAPGLKGANASGRPFTGDYAGEVLYPALRKAGFARGVYGRRPDDGLELVGTRITNAVRCVPPENKPVTEEITTCNPYLHNEIKAMPNLKVVLILGVISHQAVLKALGVKQSDYAFGHGATHRIDSHGIWLQNSYHTSRYNVQTGRLTREMFDAVLDKVKGYLER